MWIAFAFLACGLVFIIFLSLFIQNFSDTCQHFNISGKINILLHIQEVDYDDDDDEEKMTNGGDLSRDLRNDEDDLRDPVDVR